MKDISKSRFYLGGIIFIVGLCSPLLIPLVTISDLSLTWKASLTGLLALGIPEIFMVLAIAVMGKAGYEVLKSKLAVVFKSMAPADEVSLTRYRIGLILFCLPLLLGWILPYLGHFIPSFNNLGIWIYLAGDSIFLISFFVLGGNFWEKFSGLFRH